MPSGPSVPPGPSSPSRLPGEIGPEGVDERGCDGKPKPQLICVLRHVGVV